MLTSAKFKFCRGERSGPGDQVVTIHVAYPDGTLYQEMGPEEAARLGRDLCRVATAAGARPDAAFSVVANVDPGEMKRVADLAREHAEMLKLLRRVLERLDIGLDVPPKLAAGIVALVARIDAREKGGAK